MLRWGVKGRIREGCRTWRGVWHPLWRAQGRCIGLVRVSTMVGERSPHGGHVGISANTWRAAEWPAWETIVGLFQAEFGHGPKTKFAKLGLPYNFD